MNRGRVDQKHHHLNKVDDEIIAEIRRSRFLVADFTCEPGKVRGGVYFEAGFAMGLNMGDSTTYRRVATKIGRNDPCPCGSGKKFKHCCAKPTLHWMQAMTIANVFSMPSEDRLPSPPASQKSSRSYCRALNRQ
jgi:hypothetical protein